VQDGDPQRLCTAAVKYCGAYWAADMLKPLVYGGAYWAADMAEPLIYGDAYIRMRILSRLYAEPLIYEGAY
jgi:hypothetical protein